MQHGSNAAFQNWERKILKRSQSLTLERSLLLLILSMTPQGTLGTFQETKMCDVEDEILPLIIFSKYDKHFKVSTV